MKFCGLHRKGTMLYANYETKQNKEQTDCPKQCFFDRCKMGTLLVLANSLVIEVFLYVQRCCRLRKKKLCLSVDCATIHMQQRTSLTILKFDNLWCAVWDFLVPSYIYSFLITSQFIFLICFACCYKTVRQYKLKHDSCKSVKNIWCSTIWWSTYYFTQDDRHWLT